MDLSPGLGTFYVQKLPKNETENGISQGVLVVWDKNLKIGKAVIVNFDDWGTIDTSMYVTSEAKRASQIKAYIDIYGNRNNPNVKSKPIVSTVNEKWITEEQFNMLKQGAGDDFNVLSYLKSLDDVTKEDLLKSINQNSNSNSNSNSKPNINPNSNSNSNSNSSSNAIASHTNSNPSSSGSVGTSGAVVSSAYVGEFTKDAESEDSQNGPDDAKSYEVSKSPAAKSADSNSLIYALIGVLAIGILLGVGYMKRDKK